MLLNIDTICFRFSSSNIYLDGNSITTLPAGISDNFSGLSGVWVHQTTDVQALWQVDMYREFKASNELKGGGERLVDINMGQLVMKRR